MKKILKKSIKKKTTCNFSLHLNAGGGRGVELYLPTGADHAQYLRAMNFLNEFCNTFGFENRGVKGIGSWYVNKHLKKCYLLEILHALPLLNFFAGNPFTASFPSVLVKSDLLFWKFGSLSPRLKTGVDPLSRCALCPLSSNSHPN